MTAADRPHRDERAPARGLREFYENPEVPVSSGPDRAAAQARMLAPGAAGRAAARPCIVDVGCGDGAATGAGGAAAIPGTGWSAWTGRPMLAAAGRARLALTGARSRGRRRPAAGLASLPTS